MKERRGRRKIESRRKTTSMGWRTQEDWLSNGPLLSSGRAKAHSAELIKFIKIQNKMHLKDQFVG